MGSDARVGSGPEWTKDSCEGEDQHERVDLEQGNGGRDHAVLWGSGQGAVQLSAMARARYGAAV